MNFFHAGWLLLDGLLDTLLAISVGRFFPERRNPSYEAPMKLLSFSLAIASSDEKYITSSRPQTFQSSNWDR
jgi:hypothetical protein